MHLYDSAWLNLYLAAREVIARVAPERLKAFEQRMSVLRTDPAFAARKIPGLLDSDALTAIRQTMASIDRNLIELHELQRFGRFVVHDLPQFTALQHEFTDRVSDWAGEAVEPAYNFLSLYTHRGVCEPHLDGPTAKWTLDLCLDQSGPWPIHVGPIMDWPGRPIPADSNLAERIRRDRGPEFSSMVAEPGDAFLFSGSSQWHYRDPIPQGPGRVFCDLLFMHFIPKGTADLVQPANWARLFDVPELAQIEGIDRLA